MGNYYWKEENGGGGGGRHEDVGMKRIKRGRNDLETKMDTK